MKSRGRKRRGTACVKQGSYRMPDRLPHSISHLTSVIGQPGVADLFRKEVSLHEALAKTMERRQSEWLRIPLERVL